MRKIKVLGLAIVAVFALGAMLASTAFALPSFLPGTAGTTWTGSAVGETELQSTSALAAVKCKTASAEGSFTNNAEGPFHIDFKECTAAGGKCTGAGESSGVILALGTDHLVWDALTTLSAAILFSIEPSVHFTCTVLGVELLVLVSGSVLCKIKTPGTKKATYEFACEASKKGVPSETHTGTTAAQKRMHSC
jgi:hypothetical protein